MCRQGTRSVGVDWESAVYQKVQEEERTDGRTHGEAGPGFLGTQSGCHNG
jgi:hypothetical protein